MSQDTAVLSGDTETVAEWVHPLWNRLAAEAFGTFLLVLGIVGTGLYNLFNNNMILTIALAGGITLFAAYATVGHVSGGHFNPAVSFGAAVAGRFSWADVLPYWAAQLLGAMAAGAIMLATIPETLVTGLQKEDKFDVFSATANGFGLNSPMYTGTQGQVQFDLVPALLVEFVVSAVFVGVALAMLRRGARRAAAVVSSTFAALYVLSWQVTNGAINPARSTVSAILSMDWSTSDGVDSWGVSSQLWLFWVAPLAGAALAALFVRAFATEEPVVLLEETDGDDSDDWSDLGAETPVVVEETVVVVEETVVEPTEGTEAASAKAADDKLADTKPADGKPADGPGSTSA